MFNGQILRSVGNWKMSNRKQELSTSLWAAIRFPREWLLLAFFSEGTPRCSMDPHCPEGDRCSSTDSLCFAEPFLTRNDMGLKSSELSSSSKSIINNLSSRKWIGLGIMLNPVFIETLFQNEFCVLACSLISSTISMSEIYCDVHIHIVAICLSLTVYGQVSLHSAFWN